MSRRGREGGGEGKSIEKGEGKEVEEKGIEEVGEGKEVEEKGIEEVVEGKGRRRRRRWKGIEKGEEEK